MELLVDVQQWTDLARQMALDQMVAGVGTGVSPYRIEAKYYNDSDGNHLRTEETHTYDIDGSSTSGEVKYYYNTDGSGTPGVVIADYDLDNNGYRDGTLADKLAKLLSGKKKNKNKGGGDEEDTDGLIIMMPYPVQWMWMSTEPRYDRLLLTDQLFGLLYDNGTIDAIRNHIQSQQAQGLSPDAAAIQQLLDLGFSPITTNYHAVNAFALDLTVVQSW